MKNQLLTALLLGSAALVLNSPPTRGCIAMPSRYEGGARLTQPRPIRLDEQRAFLWREKSTEHMLLSVKYSGGTSEFAWVIPVESRPEISVDKGAPFTELRRATEIRAPKLTMAAPGASVGATAKAPSVEVLERKEAGPYDLAVLKASESGGLYDWLKKNDFHVSKDAKGALDYYVSRHYVFVAARIRNGAKGNEAVAERLREGKIAPLHLAFKAAQLTYPLKVTSGNPGASAMEIYVLNPDSRSHRPFQVQAFKLTPQSKESFAIAGPPGSSASGDFPTLRRLIPQGGTLTKYTGVLSDQQRQEDLVFAKL